MKSRKKASSDKAGGSKRPSTGEVDKEEGSCPGRMKLSNPTDDIDSYYNMDHKFRGKAVIFNNMDFSESRACHTG